MASTVIISITVISAFLLSIFLLSLFINPVTNPVDILNLDREENEFYSIFNNTNKSIFLIGSSQIGRLNQTYIQEGINTDKNNYTVFNLADNSDTPKKRLNSISHIVKIKPDLVIYGIGHIDFADFIMKSDLSKPETILPDPAIHLHKNIEKFEKIINMNFERWNYAKSLTINLIKNTIGIDDTKGTEDLTRENSPFYNLRNAHTIVLDELSLKRSLESNKSQLEKIYLEHENVAAIKEIIKILQTNEIPTIIISIPVSDVMLNTISKVDQKNFEDILKEISQDTDVEIIHLHDKFRNMSIWNDPTHIAYGSKSTVVNDRVLSIILENLE